MASATALDFDCHAGRAILCSSSPANLPSDRSGPLALRKKEKRAATRHGDPDEAIARYLEELRQANVQGAEAPGSALNGLGDAYFDKGDVESAVDHYRQAAEAYAREGMYDNAIACCKKIRRHAPQDDQASLLLGRFYGAKGLRADAARELEAFAERQDREGRRKEAILALAELARIAPDRPLVRERLARLYAENDQRDAALEEYRAARAEYLARGDRDGARRIEDALAEHGERPPRPVAAEPAPDRPEPIRPAEPDDPVAAGERPPIPLGLEIEHTSYADRRDGRVEAPEVAEPVGSTDTAQLVASAEGAAAAGDVDAAAARLLDAAEGLRAQRRWEDAVEAYRSLAGLGRARDDEYAAWTESARQAGMASLVLEALSAQARWHLAAGRRSSARKAAEEMLLVDPKNDVAAGILSQVGSTLPRD